MQLFTIGFTQKTAQSFFELLNKHSVQCLVDIRLHPDGQLAGFTKKQDLKYFLQSLIGCDYIHVPELAPSDELLKSYRKDHDWASYEARFEALLDQRAIPQTLQRSLFTERVCCLLCSEPQPHHCHRRLVAERLAKFWKDLEIIHL